MAKAMFSSLIFIKMIFCMVAMATSIFICALVRAQLCSGSRSCNVVVTADNYLKGPAVTRWRLCTRIFCYGFKLTGVGIFFLIQGPRHLRLNSVVLPTQRAANNVDFWWFLCC